VIGLLSAAADAVTSFVAGRWLVLAGLVAVLALFAGTYGLGRSHANARWEPRWEAREANWSDAQDKAQSAADAILMRQRQATLAAAEEFVREQTENARLHGVNSDLGRRLRSAIARPAQSLPATAADTSEPQRTPQRLDAQTVALAAIGFAEGCAKSRDDLAAQVNGLLDAWPQ